MVHDKDMVATDMTTSYSFPLKVHDKNKLPFSCLYVITNYMINNTWFTSTVEVNFRVRHKYVEYHNTGSIV